MPTPPKPTPQKKTAMRRLESTGSLPGMGQTAEQVEFKKRLDLAPFGSKLIAPTGRPVAAGKKTRRRKRRSTRRKL